MYACMHVWWSVQRAEIVRPALGSAGAAMVLPGSPNHSNSIWLDRLGSTRHAMPLLGKTHGDKCHGLGQ